MRDLAWSCLTWLLRARALAWYHYPFSSLHWLMWFFTKFMQVRSDIHKIEQFTDKTMAPTRRQVLCSWPCHVSWGHLGCRNLSHIHRTCKADNPDVGVCEPSVRCWWCIWNRQQDCNYHVMSCFTPSTFPPFTDKEDKKKHIFPCVLFASCSWMSKESNSDVGFCIQLVCVCLRVCVCARALFYNFM